MWGVTQVPGLAWAAAVEPAVAQGQPARVVAVAARVAVPVLALISAESAPQQAQALVVDPAAGRALAQLQAALVRAVQVRVPPPILAVSALAVVRPARVSAEAPVRDPDQAYRRPAPAMVPGLRSDSVEWVRPAAGRPVDSVLQQARPALELASTVVSAQAP